MATSFDNIIKINKESSLFLSQIADSYRNKKMDRFFIQFYTLNIIRRIVFYQRAIIPLIYELNKNINFEFPIAILLRAACLDILQFGYVIKALDEVKIDSNNPQPHIIPDYTDFKKITKSIYCDNLFNQLSDWKTLKDADTITDSDLKLLTEKMYRDFPEYFPESNGKKCKSPKTRDIFVILRKDNKYDLFSDVFYYYSYYSKLEHFGILSYVYSKSENTNLTEAFNKIKHISYTFLKVSQRGLLFLKREDFDVKKMDEWIDELLK